MHIEKILKFYLVMTVAITSAAALSYNQTISKHGTTYLAKAVETIDKYVNGEGEYSFSPEQNYASVVHLGGENDGGTKLFELYEQFPDVSFGFSGAPSSAYAEPGQKGVELMNLSIGAGENNLSLENLGFEINGDSEILDAAYLYRNGEVLAEGEIKDNFLGFDKINLELEAQTSAELKLLVDINEKAKVADRLRLDISSADNLGLRVEGKTYAFNASYPLRGKYLSIARQRTWVHFNWESPLSEF